MLSASPWCWLVWALHIIERYDPAKIWIQFWLIHGKLMNEKRMENFMWRILKTKQVENSQPQVENSQPLPFKVKGKGLRILNLGLRILNLINFHFSSALGCTGLQLKWSNVKVLSLADFFKQMHQCTNLRLLLHHWNSEFLFLVYRYLFP